VTDRSRIADEFGYVLEAALSVHKLFPTNVAEMKVTLSRYWQEYGPILQAVGLSIYDEYFQREKGKIFTLKSIPDRISEREDAMKLEFFPHIALMRTQQILTKLGTGPRV
jgi:hypothetical protein